MVDFRLSDVFGIGSSYHVASYVDRGNLDARLNYLLGTDRHIVIHGDSKQGKSWLRAKVLGATGSLPVQCQPKMTPEAILREALGRLGVRATLKRVSKEGLEGSLDFNLSGEASVPLLTKLGLSGKIGRKATTEMQTESEPIGETPASIDWVAKILSASERRLVIEDFHYLSEADRKSFTYLIKALGECGVHPVLVGVWPQDHLMTYYNGDLDGRVEDIHLEWSSTELDQVLRNGCSALDIGMSASLRNEIVADAYRNVGLLQRLAEQLCLVNGIQQQSRENEYLVPGPAVADARVRLARSMTQRYQGFIDNAVYGLRRLPAGVDVCLAILRVITEASDGDAVEGVEIDTIRAQVASILGRPVTRQETADNLARFDRLQVAIDIKPAIVSYDRDARRLFVVDKSFLFFRKYGRLEWPWLDDEFVLTNDLAEDDPLDLT